MEASQVFILGRDFINLYVGGGLIADGNITTLFSQENYLRAVREIYGETYPVHNWSYPPTMFWVALGFSFFDYFFALFLWFALGAVLLFCATRALGLSPVWAVVIFLSPAGVFNLVTGQNGFVTAALITMAFAFASQRPGLAGLNWALLTMKPHLGIVALPLLVIHRRWKTIGAGGAFFACLAGSTLVVWGAEPWQRFLTETVQQQQVVLEEWDGLLLKIMPTVFIQGRIWGFSVTASYMLHAAFAGLGVLLAIRAWPDREATVRRSLTWFVVTTLLVLPYSFVYDWVVFQIILILWIWDPDALFVLKPGTSRLVWSLLWWLPFLSCFFALTLSFHLGPVVLAFVLWRLGCKRTNAPPAGVLRV
ncbi:hypothetical protein AN191_00450 [Loktanella sp. 5RATIMAR09]|nr:hypothetical protein AN191_00450 [Loktanella sp. 5RATIMAR09]